MKPTDDESVGFSLTPIEGHMTYRSSYFQFEGELDSARSAIEAELGFSLAERDSSYWGGTYFLFKDATSNFQLQLYRNLDHRGDAINSEFKESQILCSLYGPVAMVEQFVASMVGARGLLIATRTREIDDEPS